MAKSKKTDKPEDAQTDVKPEAEEIIDAEVVVETLPDGETPDTPTEADDVVELENPEDTDETAEAEELIAVDAEEPVEDAGPEPEAETPVQSEPAEKSSGSGFAPMLIGGVVAAGIGFAAASYLGSQGILFGANPDEEIAELTRKLDDQQDLIALLKSNQDKIANTANEAREGATGVADANARAAALSERVEALGGKVQALEGRLIEAEKRPMTEGASSSAIEAYEQEVEQLRSLVAEQLAEAETLKEASARTAQETLAQAALTLVISALDSGAPYRGALTELASVTGVAIPSDLSAHADKGVPTNITLADAFPDYARAALADARKQEGDGGNRLSNFLKTQLGARSTEPKEGDDADAILSRAEAALREGRLAASLQELEALPESSQALMAEWRALAETRLAATQAAETLAQSLNSN